MTTAKPTESHLQAVAYIVEAITEGRWHRPGIMAALRECEGPLWLIAHAAIVCAHSRTDQTTPAVIAMIGPHWDDPTKPHTDKPGPPPLPRFRDDLAGVQAADPATIAALKARAVEAARTATIPTRPVHTDGTNPPKETP